MERISETMSVIPCNEDRISGLPDAIRCHILSFLPTRDSVRTCILSHRWSDVWTSVPNLDLIVTSSNRDLGFVDRVLLFRSFSNIHRFRLHCHWLESCMDHVDAWISTAIKRNVVELDLCLIASDRLLPQCLELPRSLFICKTLVVLKMMLTTNVTALPPNSNCFPSLKYLNVFIDFPRVLDPVEKLFSCSSFPALEELIVHGNVGEPREDGVLNLTLFAPKLKRLQINLRAHREDHSFATDVEEYNIYVNADVPNLENLILEYFLASYSLKNAKSLSAVKLKFRSLHARKNLFFAERLHRLFSEILNVKSLSVLAPIIGDADIAYRYPLPTFKNLNSLELRLQTCCSWQSLKRFLHASPNLEDLVLENNLKCRVIWEDVVRAHVEGVDEDGDDSDYSDRSDEEDLVHEWCPPEIVPACLLLCLKTVCIQGFRGYIDEMEVAEYLLKHGKALKKVTIHTSNFPASRVMELWNKFARFPRSSKACVLEWVIPKL